MLKNTVFVLCVITLSFELASSKKRCVINKFGTEQCESDVCFSHFHTVLEGQVEKFDCDEEPTKLNKSSCSALLQSSKQSSICLENGHETHCCCLATLPAQICAQQNRRTDELFALWSIEQALFLFFGHITLGILVILLGLLYKTAKRKWPAENVEVADGSKLNYVLVAKPVMLFLSFVMTYFPFRKNCMNHPKGVFHTPRLFLYQIFDPGMGPSLYFSFPIVFCFFDFMFSVNVRRCKSINKSGALGLSIFKLITVPLFVYETYISSLYLWQKDTEPGYCRLGGALLQLVLSHSFILVYHILLAVQTGILCSMSPPPDLNEPISEEVSSHVATLMSTQTLDTRIESGFNDMLYIHPRPFSVPRGGQNVLYAKNNRNDKWIVLRVLLSTTGFYKVHPSKFFIPPGEKISMEIENCCSAENHANHHLLFEWFTLAHDHPTLDPYAVWEKPYMVAQDKWQFFVLPIYLDDSQYE